jgi:hypothetical protein
LLHFGAFKSPSISLISRWVRVLVIVPFPLRLLSDAGNHQGLFDGRKAKGNAARTPEILSGDS